MRLLPSFFLLFFVHNSIQNTLKSCFMITESEVVFFSSNKDKSAVIKQNLIIVNGFSLIGIKC